MQINAAQQLKSPLGDTRYYSIDETTREGFHIRGEAKLVRTNRSILVTGQFITVVRCTCSRCLEEFECPLEFEMEEEYFPAGAIPNGLAGPVADDMDGFAIGGDHILDLNEAVRQNILINLPAKPLCQEECAGLCQRCGYNLNYGPCHCVGEQGDPRWTPLGALLSTEIAGDKKRG
ncbi:DUF177 domain-containing protein [Dehalococcoidia bacterium]|nr:DUF177 domain-containing protein [Dehalococcoidia bacterium]